MLTIVPAIAVIRLTIPREEIRIAMGPAMAEVTATANGLLLQSDRRANGEN